MKYILWGLRINYLVFFVTVLLVIFVIYFPVGINFNIIRHGIIDLFLIKSVNPIEINNSLQITFINSLMLVPINFFVNALLLKYFFDKKHPIIFEEIRNSNRLLFYTGFYVLSPYETETKIAECNIFKKLFVLIIYSWVVFLSIYQILDLDFIKFPKIESVIFLVSNYKIFLLIFNFIVFFSVSSTWLGFLCGVILLLKSFFTKFN